MKKKGLLAMGLAGVLTVGMCMPVFAGEITETMDSKGSAVDVKLEKTETYSVTIPTELKVNDTETEFSVTATGNLIEGNELKVEIKELAANGISVQYYKDNLYKTEVSGKMANVSVTKNGTALSDSDKTVATFKNGNDPKDNAGLINDVGTLKLGKKPDDVQAGYYKGTATFEVSVVAPVAP